MLHEWKLIAGFSLLLIFAMILFLHPLRGSGKRTKWMGMLLLSGLVILTYNYYGSLDLLQNYYQKQQKQAEIKEYLAKIKSPQALIDTLRSKLDNSPASAKGWYLLGRLYANQNQWQQAADAFGTAYRLNPDDEKASVNYAQALWQVNGQAFNTSVETMLQQILQKNPEQADSLAMLAVAAYQKENYKEAITLWQRLLYLTRPDSDEAKMLQKMIAKANQQLSN